MKLCTFEWTGSFGPVRRIGALTPAGLGCSCLIPLIKAGFVDWIVSVDTDGYDLEHRAPRKSGTRLWWRIRGRQPAASNR